MMLEWYRGAATLRVACKKRGSDDPMPSLPEFQLPQKMTYRDTIFCGEKYYTATFLLATYPLSAVATLSCNWLGFSAASEVGIGHRRPQSL